ncbi:MAG: hypothetical protein M3Z09_10595 [Acidobacteriota bacterium]|nr:hypothetical protein [Acidobacteriota bacterium]
MTRLAWIPALLILCGLPAGAQTRGRKPQPNPTAAAPATEFFPLRRIQIKGNKLLTAAQIESVAALPLFKPLKKSDFDAARDRLLATGFFESVAFQFGSPSSAGPAYSYEAVFEVNEVPAVYPVQFENLPVPAVDIEAGLKAGNPFYGPKLPATQQVIGFYTRQIEQILAAHNHPGRVLGELVPSGKDDFKILFRPAEPLPSVSNVTFTGNQAISTITLQNAINDVAFGSPFSRDHFRMLLDNQIRPLYEAKGLLRVAFPVFSTEPDPKVKGVRVHVTVEEGPPYKLSKITLAGADPDYMDVVKVKPGGVANFDEINDALDRVKKQLKRNGFLETEGTVERRIDDKAHTVGVAIQVKPGPQFTMGKLAIAGLDLNTEPVVRKLWIVGEGKPFNATYPDYFLQRIREDGLFDGLGTMKAATRIDDKTHVADVTLTFGSSPKPKPAKRPGLRGEDPEEPTKPAPPPF